MSYYEHLISLTKESEEITFDYLTRDKNHFANALATLAIMTKLDLEVEVRPLQVAVRKEPAYCLNIEEEPDYRPQFHDIR